MRYKVGVSRSIVRKTPRPDAGKNGDLGSGAVIDITDQQNGYGYTEYPIKGWIKMTELKLVEEAPPPVEPPTTEPAGEYILYVNGPVVKKYVPE